MRYILIPAIIATISCSPAPANGSNKNDSRNKSSIDFLQRKINSGCDVYIPKNMKIANRDNFPNFFKYKRYLEKRNDITGSGDFSPCFYMSDGDSGCLFVMDDGPSIGRSFNLCKVDDHFEVKFEE